MVDIIEELKEMIRDQDDLHVRLLIQASDLYWLLRNPGQVLDLEAREWVKHLNDKYAL